VGASTLEVIELIHELITLDQELMTLDVGVPVVEAPVVPAVVVVVVAVVVTVVEVVVAGGVLVLLLHAAPTLPIAMTAIVPAVAATRRAMRRDLMASSLVLGLSAYSRTLAK
jgi:hypothetical protein